MTIISFTDFAKRITGRQIGQAFSDEDRALAQASGLLIVYGASDDLIEMEGMFRDEAGVEDGDMVYVTDEGLVEKPECDCSHAEDWYAEAISVASEIEALWCPDDVDGNPSWAYRTDLPHATFTIVEGGELYCIGLVIDFMVRSSPCEQKD